MNKQTCRNRLTDCNATVLMTFKEIKTKLESTGME